MEENEVYGMPESKAFRLFKKIIKTVFVALVFIFIGAFILRIMFADYYPKNMKSFLFTDGLTEYYNENPESFSAYRLDMSMPYIPDYDAEGTTVGNFFAANVTFIPDAKSMQLFIRFNRAAIATINEEYNLSLTEEDIKDAIVFSLYEPHGDGKPEYTPVYEEYGELWIYNYVKLSYEGVENLDSACCFYVNVTLSQTGELLGSIPVYLADSDADDFEKIDFKKSELPK